MVVITPVFSKQAHDAVAADTGADGAREGKSAAGGDAAAAPASSSSALGTTKRSGADDRSVPPFQSRSKKRGF